MPLRISGGEDGETRGKVQSKRESSADTLPTAAVSEAGVVAVASGGPAGPMRQQQEKKISEKITPSRSAAAVGVVDKRSREYVLKSGLAGGLAGCAVCDTVNSSLSLTC